MFLTFRNDGWNCVTKGGNFFHDLNFCWRASFLSFLTSLGVFVLRSLRASPMTKPFLTPAGWQLFKCVHWNVSECLMCTYIKDSFFSNRVSLIDCCVRECSSQWKKFYYIPCSLQSREILLRLWSIWTFDWPRVGASQKNDSKGEVDPLPALPPYYLWVALKKKKNEYNLKIPFQCFISINSDTGPNLKTTFNLVTSSLLLMGHVSFPIPLGFQSQVED